MTIAEEIKKNTGKFHKSYGFDEGHNPFLPSDYWWQETPEGRCFFLVMYTLACRWSKCIGCNLPSKQSIKVVDYLHLMKQTDFVFDFLLTPRQRETMGKIILSNNGSVLDEATFSTTALIYFVAKTNMNCPNLKILTIETRAEYVDFTELEVIKRALSDRPKPANLEVAIGFEAFDERVRNNLFGKGMTLKGFEKMARDIAAHGFQLKTYFMLKPVVEFTNLEATRDLKCAVDYLATLSASLSLKVNLHINPTYVARGTPLETAFHAGLYTPPDPHSVFDVIRYTEGKGLGVYVGCSAEGLEVEGGHFLHRQPAEYRDWLEKFNKTQDYSHIHRFFLKKSS